MKDIFDTKQILPKLWLSRIQKYWEKKIPTGYPESSSSFEFTTGNDKIATLEMESKLGTDESIIKPEVIPAKEAVGKYLGTYDVQAEAGVNTLLSPAAVPNNATGAIAYHYDSEEDSWNLIEDVTIENGYVWGTLDSFSPIAVFTFRKDSYVDTEKEEFDANVYVCNGIPTRIYKNSDGTIVAESAYGKVTEIDKNYFVVGGSLDGSVVDTTYVSVFGDAELAMLVGGSWYTKDSNHKMISSSVKVSVSNSKIKTLTGAGIWNSVDYIEINLTDSEITSGLGCQESYYKGKSSNVTLQDSELGLLSNQWVKNSVINVTNSKVNILYAGGNNGFSYTRNAKLFVKNSECKYICCSQSNGTIDNVYAELVDTKIETNLASNNRGHVGSVVEILKGVETTNGCIFCDPTEPDPSMADIKDISIDIDATSNMTLCVGSISNVEVTTGEVAAKYIKSLKISRNANIVYTRNAEKILKDIIVIK